MTQRGLGHITEVLDRDDTVLFIGSGLSTWSGLPTWSGLIERLRDKLVGLGRGSELVERELGNGDLLLAASYGVDQLTPQERCQFLREAVQARDRGPSEIHEAVAKLRPTCFITTNYDTLLERALTQHRSGEAFEVVTPANVLEIPAIMQARSHHFVFKPHGDIGNCDSIVLTREDYRRLQSDRRNVFEATRTLLSSRPVVFLGFGLRDPDFLMMRDQLLNTFDSNPADHIAIMPDVHEAENAYWRRHYGIDLVSYATNTTAPRNQRHAQLMDLIQELSQSTAATSAADLVSDSMMLTLARYGRGLVSNLTPVSKNDFPLTFTVGHPEKRPGQTDYRLARKLRGEAVSTLSRFHGHLVIEGPPGAGKSHILNRVARGLADDLEAACLSSSSFNFRQLRIPVLVSLRDYRGDLIELIEEKLPVDVSLEQLLRGKVGVLLLDGLNEAPASAEQENILNEQIETLLAAAAESTVIITTRFADQLSATDVPVAALDAVTDEALRAAVEAAGLDESRLNPITLDLLRRPLFFSSWMSGHVSIQEAQSIHDVYVQLIASFEREASDRFGVDISMSALSRVAYKMIDGGDLSSPLVQVLSSLHQELPGGVDVQRFYEFLVSKGVLIATPLRRLAFYHHSVTEYLAAYHLSEQIEIDNSVVAHCLGRREWDQALLLSLGFLATSTAIAVHERIMHVDSQMGLRSLHYVESNQSEWINRSLQKIPDGLSLPEAAVLADIMADLPLEMIHVRALEELSKREDHLGGCAFGMIGILDNDRFDEVANVFLSGRRGYNFNAGLSDVFASRLDTPSALRILDRLEEIEVSDNVAASLLAGEEVEETIAVTGSVAGILGRVPVAQLVRRAARTTSTLALVSLSEALRERREVPAVTFIRGEILRGARYAIVDHYFQVAFGKPEDTALPDVSAELIDRFVSALSDATVGRWALEALRTLVDMQPEAGEMIVSGDMEGLRPALLAYARGDYEVFDRLLLSLAEQGVDWRAEPIQCLEAINRWRPNVVLAVLSTRDPVLAAPVLDSFGLEAFNEGDLAVHLEDVVWWLDWLDELSESEPYAAYNLGRFLARGTSVETRTEFVRLFNMVPKRRKALADFVLPEYSELSISELEDAAVEWLFTQLGKGRPRWHESLLTRLATERIVEERLLPLLFSDTDEATRVDVVRTLQRVGRRHGRRYVGDDGEVVA